MNNQNKPEQRAGMTEKEREERLRRVNEFWWGKRPPQGEENRKENK